MDVQATQPLLLRAAHFCRHKRIFHSSLVISAVTCGTLPAPMTLPLHWRNGWMGHKCPPNLCLGVPVLVLGCKGHCCDLCPVLKAARLGVSHEAVPALSL